MTNKEIENLINQQPISRNQTAKGTCIKCKNDNRSLILIGKHKGMCCGCVAKYYRSHTATNRGRTEKYREGDRGGFYWELPEFKESFSLLKSSLGELTNEENSERAAGRHSHKKAYILRNIARAKEETQRAC